MSRLAREHPEDECYQSLEGQYDALTICEDGELRPTRNEFGGVVDRFGVYRMPEDESHPQDRELRFIEGREL